MTGHDTALARAQGAELAKALGLPGDPGPRGDSSRVTVRQRDPVPSGREVTSTRAPTTTELELVAALAVHPRQAWRPGQLIGMYPETFGHRTPAGLHITAQSAWRKGLVRRRRRAGDRVGWQVTPMGLRVLAAHDEKALR